HPGPNRGGRDRHHPRGRRPVARRRPLHRRRHRPDRPAMTTAMVPRSAASPSRQPTAKRPTGYIGRHRLPSPRETVTESTGGNRPLDLAAEAAPNRSTADGRTAEPDTIGAAPNPSLGTADAPDAATYPESAASDVAPSADARDPARALTAS